CIVPYTRGKERSRLLKDILIEIESLIEAGFKEITLLGQNVNAYGKDLVEPLSFSDLLQTVANMKIERVRFMTSHPWDFSDEMIDIIANNANIMPYIHLPLQSGNNDILKIMGRRYTKEQYLEIVAKLKSRVKGIAFSTDIIVGFPNESEAQFLDTMAMMDLCQFDNVYTFVYSAREHTPAALMADSVSQLEKEQRLQRLNQRVAKYALQNNLTMVNQVVKVLVDGPSRKNPDVYSGYTENNKLVNFSKMDVKVGEIVEIEITGAKTWTLQGKLI
ncbi:MAG: MiaB/RimO family radical SAM methylthiotransferase, partial [Erysipelotrichaceae bacterium]